MHRQTLRKRVKKYSTTKVGLTKNLEKHIVYKLNSTDNPHQYREEQVQTHHYTAISEAVKDKLVYILTYRQLRP